MYKTLNEWGNWYNDRLTDWMVSYTAEEMQHFRDALHRIIVIVIGKYSVGC